MRELLKSAATTLTNLSATLVKVSLDLNPYRKRRHVTKTRLPIYISIDNAYCADLPDAARVSLDIAVDDMKEDIEERHYKLKETCFLAASLCFLHICAAVCGVAVCLSIPAAVMFSCISITFGRLAMELAGLSTAATLIITERKNVPPYCGPDGI